MRTAYSEISFLGPSKLPYRTQELYSIKTSFWPCLWHGEFASSLPLPSAQAKACWGRCPQTPICFYPQSFYINSIFTIVIPFIYSYSIHYSYPFTYNYLFTYSYPFTCFTYSSIIILFTHSYLINLQLSIYLQLFLLTHTIVTHSYFIHQQSFHSPIVILFTHNFPFYILLSALYTITLLFTYS